MCQSCVYRLMFGAGALNAAQTDLMKLAGVFIKDNPDIPAHAEEKYEEAMRAFAKYNRAMSELSAPIADSLTPAQRDEIGMMFTPEYNDEIRAMILGALRPTIHVDVVSAAAEMSIKSAMEQMMRGPSPADQDPSWNIPGLSGRNPDDLFQEDDDDA